MRNIDAFTNEILKKREDLSNKLITKEGTQADWQ